MKAAELVAARVGVQPRGDGSLLLLWNTVVWGAFCARHASALLRRASAEGRPDEVAEHEACLGAMVAHNARSPPVDPRPDSS